jgi:hypothetical protein
MFNDVRRESKTRLVKKDKISTTRFSVVALMPVGVDRDIVTSLHASIGVSGPPASTMSLLAAGAFYSNSVELLQMWLLVAGSSIHKWSSR